jgi:hypothetical protein
VRIRIVFRGQHKGDGDYVGQLQADGNSVSAPNVTSVTVPRDLWIVMTSVQAGKMNRSIGVALVVMSAGFLAADNHALSQTWRADTIVLGAPHRLVRTDFPCAERAATALAEVESRARIQMATQNTEKAPSSVKIDEANNTIRQVSQMDLQIGNAEGSKFKIIFKNEDMIVGLNESSEQRAVIVIDKTTSRIVRMSAGLFLRPTASAIYGLSATASFYECQ